MSKKRDPNEPERRRLTRDEREAAEEIAVELYSECQTANTVQRALATHFAIPMRQARDIALKARTKLYQADLSESLSDRKVAHEKRIMTLYRRALEKGQLKVCASLLTQLAKLHQLDAPTRIEVTQKADPFADRTDAELEHYVEHGCWPEEEPAPAVH